MKYKSLFVFALIFIVALSFNVFAKPKVVVTDCPITPETDFAFYGDTGRGGVGDLSKSWLTHFLDWWKTQDPSLNYVILDAGDVKGGCNLVSYPNLKLYIQPGGDAYWQQRTLSSAGKTNLLNYINSGKAYLGICAGAYYAAGDYFWQGSYYDWNYLLGVYPTLEGSITTIADYDENPPYALTGVSSGHNMIYYGGPTRGWQSTSSVYPGEALLTYTAVPGDLPAAIRDNNLLLMSVHAEAYENEGIVGLSTQQRVENYIWFANAINDLAGTNFYVPSSQMSQCGNFVCETGENYLNCPSDCEAPQVNESICGNGVCEVGEDEFSCFVDCYVPQEQVLFYEDFESGALWNWFVSGTGNPWVVSTDFPYQGTYSAMSLQSGAGEPTYMEAYFNTSSQESLVLEYDRKLVGLDAADDFEVAYSTGAGWTVLEHVVSTTDPGYVHRSFEIPNAQQNSMFMLRFMCETGAVSEMCFVDNVKVTGV